MNECEIRTFYKRLVDYYCRVTDDDPDDAAVFDPRDHRDDLAWLIDVPLFVDEDRIHRLHDIVVTPIFQPYAKTPTGSTEGQTTTGEIEAGGGVDGELTTGAVEALPGASLSGSLNGTARMSTTESEQQTYTLTQQPQRQLAQVVIQYLRDGGSDDSESDSEGFGGTFERFEEFDNFADYADEFVGETDGSPGTPRDLVVLELPGRRASDSNGGPFATALVPTAAEFADGAVVPLYDRLDLGRERPPRYPQRELSWAELGNHYEKVREDDGDDTGDEVGESVEGARNAYWQWFDEHFDPKAVIETIEEAGEEHGRVRWIDFRLPYTDEGKTLHLHVQGRERYSTGTFAYNLVKRGYEHGLTLVGTVKSEPDMDVLAVYEH